MARLVIYSSGSVNQAVALTGRNLRIGRATENDVVLADPTQVVSRFHAELRWEEGRYILLDLNSANGTWVWDHRIQRIVLDPGIVAEIGSYRLVLETDAEATTAPPVSAATGSLVVPAAVPAEKQSTEKPADAGPGFTVILAEVGAGTVNVIRAVSAATGLSLSEAMDVVERIPNVLRHRVSLSEADAIRRRLEEAGAKVEVRPS